MRLFLLLEVGGRIGGEDVDRDALGFFVRLNETLT